VVRGIKWKEGTFSREYARVSPRNREKPSEHPLPFRLSGFRRFRNMRAFSESDLESLAGKGLKAILNEDIFYCWQQDLLDENGIKIDEELLRFPGRWNLTAMSVSFLADSEKALFACLPYQTG